MTSHFESQDRSAVNRAARLDRVRRLSAGMAAACLAAAVLLTLGMATYWWTTTATNIFRQAGLPIIPSADVGAFVRLGAFSISMIPLGALIYGLLAARRCFQAFSNGRIFSPETIGGLRSFALAVAASALLKPLAGAALCVFLSASASTPTRSLVLKLDSDTLISLLFAGMVAIIAWVLSEATEVADENRQFI
ncbi:MAG: DUF2975 domain-containing protein [Proteobacteria bacterium]|nr:DUF2975 domain-containing protein [Pseudomonadota bacterium]